MDSLLYQGNQPIVSTHLSPPSSSLFLNYYAQSFQQIRMFLATLTRAQMFRYKKQISKLLLFKITNSHSEQDLQSFLIWVKNLLCTLQASTKLVNKNFPHFNSVIRLSQRRLNRVIFKQQTPLKIKKVSESNKLTGLVQQKLRIDQEISSTNFTVLKNDQKINQVIQKIMLQKKYLPNPQCFQCSQLYFQHQKIINNNPLFSKIYAIPEEEMVNRVVLKKTICALANQGLSILIIGGRDNVIEGIPYDQHREQQLLRFIWGIQSSIYPKIYCSTQRICTQKNVVNASGKIKKNLYVWRITIIPHYPSLVHYYTVKTMGYNNKQQVFIFSEKDSIISAQNSKIQDSLYELFISKRKKYKQKGFKNCHYQNCKPIPLTKQNISQSDYESPDEEQIQSMVEQNVDQQLKPMYKNQSLLIITSNSKMNFIQRFKQRLTLSKILFELKKPFENDLQQGGRNPFFFSYEIREEDMKKIVKEVSGNSKKVMFLPVYRCLQIKKKLMDQSFNKNNFFGGMRKKYPYIHQNILNQPVIKEIADGTVAIYEFSTNQMAIFAFLLLQKLQIRPFFVKQGEVYQVKQ